MSKFKRGDRIMYYGAFNESLEESTGRVLKVNRANGLVFIEIDYPVESDSGNPCDAWVHPYQLRKRKKATREVSDE